MAQRKKGKERDTSKLIQPKKRGGEEIKGGASFLNMEVGETVEGTIIGTRMVPDQRGKEVERFMMQSGDKTLTLPSHFDLDDKLRKVASTQPNAKVYIQFLGFELNVPKVPGNKLARYYVEVLKS